MSIALGVAIIGFGVGLAVGQRLMHLDRSAPMVGGIAFAVVFYQAASLLVTAAVAAAVIILAWLGLRALEEWRGTIRTFAANAGMRLAARDRPNYGDRLAKLQDDFQERVTAIKSLGLERDFEEILLEREQSRLKDQIRDAMDAN